MNRIVCALAVLCTFVIGGVYADNHNHHSGAGFKPNASHPIHSGAVPGHSLHANTNAAGKVTTMHAMSGGKKLNHSRVVKAGKKHVGLGGNGEIHYASTEVDEESCQGGIASFIGFLFNIGGQIYIFWFPANVVGIDPASLQTYP